MLLVLFIGMVIGYTALALYFTGRFLALELRYRRVRRSGVHVTGEVTDVWTRRAARGGFYVKPIVRYHVGRREFIAVVINRKGAHLHSHMELVVDEGRPEKPWALRQSTLPATLAGVTIVDLIALVLLWSAFA